MKLSQNFKKIFSQNKLLVDTFTASKRYSTKTCVVEKSVLQYNHSDAVIKKYFEGIHRL